MPFGPRGARASRSRRCASTVETTSVGLRSRPTQAFHTIAAITEIGGINNNFTNTLATSVQFGDATGWICAGESVGTSQGYAQLGYPRDPVERCDSPQSPWQATNCESSHYGSAVAHPEWLGADQRVLCRRRLAARTIAAVPTKAIVAPAPAAARLAVSRVTRAPPSARRWALRVN